MRYQRARGRGFQRSRQERVLLERIAEEMAPSGMGYLRLGERRPQSEVWQDIRKQIGLLQKHWGHLAMLMSELPD